MCPGEGQEVAHILSEGKTLRRVGVTDKLGQWHKVQERRRKPTPSLFLPSSVSRDKRPQKEDLHH